MSFSQNFLLYYRKSFTGIIVLKVLPRQLNHKVIGWGMGYPQSVPGRDRDFLARLWATCNLFPAGLGIFYLATTPAPAWGLI
jgi:hypothetical protein